ncbi:MAG: EamA family transporter, partial [Candidatus Aenigmarchaeota archaeon]|nr:EamA family transporter [Candidatus Aenigmarchaeota archaeon]
MEREYWLVTISAILSGGIIFGSRLFAEIGLSFYQFSVFHVIFIFILLPLVVFKKECRPSKGMLKLFIPFGLLSASMYFTEFGPIFLGVPVAIVVLLLYTQPVWTTVLGSLFLKENITRYKVLAVILVMLGVISLVNPFTVAGIGSVFGVMLALLGGFLLSIWIIISRIAGIRKYNPITTKFSYSIFALIFLIVFYPLTLFFVNDPTITTLSFDVSLDVWVYMGLYSVLLVFLPNILYFQGLKKVPASISGIILLLEPVVAAILASVFLQQPLTFNIL